MHKKTGMVVGKFMPLHKGHERLIHFASKLSNLTVLVDSWKSEQVPAPTRAQWIQTMFPSIQVLPIDTHMPASEEESASPAEFWATWKNKIYSMIGFPELVFTSEFYGEKLAKTLNAEWIPCDISRTAIPISATQIKEDKIRNWKYISQPAQEYFQKRVVVMGPESTGKTTLCLELAAAMNSQGVETKVIPEYAEEYIKHTRSVERLNLYDLEFFLSAQVASLESANRYPSPLVIMDTDYLTTQVWAEHLFSKQLMNPIPAQPDLTILTSPEVEWFPDSHRVPSEREQSRRWRFFRLCQEHLKREGRKYMVLDGTSFVARQNAAYSAILELIRTI